MSKDILSDSLEAVYPVESQLKLFTASKRVSPETWVKRYQKLNLIVLQPFVNALTVILTKCLDCGYVCKKRPNSVKYGHGCRNCDRQAPLTTEIINERLSKRGITLKEDYKGVMQHHKIVYKCGHLVNQRLNSVLNNGRGCTICAKGGFNTNRTACLYYLKITWFDRASEQQKTIYKIGITNLSVKKRYQRENYYNRIKTIFSIQHPNGKLVRACEGAILDAFKADRYTDISPLETVGTTEMFSRDLSLEPEFKRLISNFLLTEI